jgi:hypothetical protein
VVLYTDGLVERRDRPLAEGMTGLGRCMAHAPTDDADAICDFLLEEMATGAQDDVALLVMIRQ